ncbi:amidohydrolase family protein [Aestuariispira insulae]|uniref:Tat protein secretion system quality control protein TatD with DNase activity n=1 Tax=Aestuariispira insulae TaxID=1461337 RepID=A0A3D9HRM9_9PROT|nr:amidohydrolase family protein [Aestuariispira insulae]RED52055.1 Tat protein secretion system quality control protein TatD with DNase activity [Aestuariispira insulae]
MHRVLRAAVFLAGLASSFGTAADELPLIDGHIHYSHDAWEETPPEQAIEILRAAGLWKALVSSSSDEGTQKLYQLAPDLVVPVLRPYRKRGELGRWFRDETVPDMLAERIAQYHYLGIGEFHVSGADADSQVMRAVVQLAKKHDLFLHAHSDADAVDRIFKQDSTARVLWAHAGFEPVEVIRAMMGKHKKLWADLSFRTPETGDGGVRPEWRALFEEFPDRFLIGTDTYTPERWSYVGAYADQVRSWLAALPEDQAIAIAHGNAERLLAATRTP